MNQHKERRPPSDAERLFPRKVVLLLLGALILFMLISMPQYIREIQSPNWPTASGVITVSQLREGEIRRAPGMIGYIPDVRYTYNVGGFDFEGSKIDFHLQQSLHLKEYADRWLEQFPTGKVVTVYYSPKDASVAVLVPGIQSEQRGLFYFGIGFITAAAVAFVLVLLFYQKEPHP